MVAINEKLRPGAERPLPAGNYYLLQDTLYRAAALTDSSGNIVEAYDTDAYGDTLIFTAAGSGGNWQVVQRYVYSPYGTITVLNADWSTTPTGTQPLVDNLYQGMTLDSVTGLYDERFRNYSPSLGRWINQDPAGYINGANTYQFVASDPAGATDPSGLAHRKGKSKLTSERHSRARGHGGKHPEGFTKRPKRGRDAQDEADRRRGGEPKQSCRRGDAERPPSPASPPHPYPVPPVLPLPGRQPTVGPGDPLGPVDSGAGVGAAEGGFFGETVFGGITVGDALVDAGIVALAI